MITRTRKNLVKTNACISLSLTLDRQWVVAPSTPTDQSQHSKHQEVAACMQ